MPKIEEIYWRAECSFADSHKHGMLSEIMGVSWPEAVGIVAAFFGQVRRQFPDGVVTRISDDMLRHWCRSKKISMTALVGATWVDKTPDNELHVHGWDERYSEIALKRMAEKEKKRYQRAEEKRRLSGQKRDNVPILSPECPQNVPAVPAMSPPYTRAGDSERDSEKKKPTTLPPVGGLFGSPEKVAPKKPTTDQARVVEAYQGMFEERFGYPPAADKTKPFVQAANAIRALGGGATAADTLIGLLPRYFDLSETDKFFHGASFSKFVLGDTLNKLRAPSAVDRGQRILDEVFGPRNGDGE